MFILLFKAKSQTAYIAKLVDNQSFIYFQTQERDVQKEKLAEFEKRVKEKEQRIEETEQKNQVS